MPRKKNKIERPEIPVTLTNVYVLTRHDGLVKKGTQIDWIEWKENGTFKQKHDKPEIGLSCILDGNRFSYSWMTTTITEHGVNEDGNIWFNTENSKYTLTTEQQLIIDDLLP